MLCEDCNFLSLWKDAENKLAKANFITGWLTGALKGRGMTNAEAMAEVAKAEAEAERVYGSVK